VQVPLVVHAFRHLVVPGARAQQEAVETARSKHRLERVDQALVGHRDDGDAAARDDAAHLGERRARRGDVLEHLRAVDALPRAISEGQVLGIALHQRAALRQPALGLLEQRLGEVDPEAPSARYLRQDVSGTAADLQNAVAGACREQGEDATDPLALDVPDQWARMVVELLDVVLLDHLVVPRLELPHIAEGAHAHCSTPCRVASAVIVVAIRDRQACRARAPSPISANDRSACVPTSAVTTSAGARRAATSACRQ
jgi:hypothetical protein